MTILFYTNNLLPKKLLENTFRQVTSLGREVLVTSHFPITTKYEVVDISDGRDERMYAGKINLESKEARIANIYKHLVKDLNVDCSGKKCKEYVVGKLPYTHRSIFKQLIFALEKSSEENVVFMEHDCFYPDDYIQLIEWILHTKDFCYCHNRYCYFDFDGFFRADTRFLLSGCSGKRELLLSVFRKKLELLNSGQSYYYEPMLDVVDDVTRSKYAGELLIGNHYCIDEWLSGDILDIKHKLNQGGQMHILRNYPGALKEYEKIAFHPYWGSADRFFDMIKIDIDRQTEAECVLGTNMY